MRAIFADVGERQRKTEMGREDVFTLEERI